MSKGQIFLCWVLLVSSFIQQISSTASQRPAQQCEGLKLGTQPDVSILTITGLQRRNVSTAGVLLMGLPEQAGLNICDITVVLNHQGSNDQVLVQVWLPLDGWNGRFIGAGGGAFYGSLFDLEFGQAVARGYAVAGTDAGLFANMTEDLNRGSWILEEKGRINNVLLRNWARRSVHDMAVVGKAVTEAFYGVKPKFSYWYGCSTGGRQGYMEAQRYPKDFDGILAIAPNLNSPILSIANMWPQIIMNQLKVFPPPCVFDKFLDEMVVACDEVDGVKDGIIVDPSACTFDPSVVVGTNASCDGALRTISSQEAEVVRQILKGPVASSGSRLWYGISLGTPFFGTAKTELRNRTVVGVPYSTAEAWIRYFLKKDPAYNPSGASFTEMEQYLRQSIDEYGELYDTINPNLSDFRQAGGKLLTWHGVADEMIPYQGTVHYHQYMERKLGGAATLDDFYRVFFAPGVQHCGGGTGPVPTDPLADLVSWVEDGRPPEIMRAATKNPQGALITRNLCLYPRIWKYKGQGDLNTAESWTCQKNLACGPICGNIDTVQVSQSSRL